MKLRSLVCILISIGIASSAFANQRLIDSGYTVITTNEPADDLSWAVMNAHHTASRAYDLIAGPMFDAAINAAQGNDINYQNHVFQFQKQTLNKILAESTFYVSLFADTTIQIANDGYGNSFTFFYPKGDLATYGILQSDNIDTVENSEIALKHINTMIDNVNALFPSDILLGSMKAFASKSTSVKSSVSGGEIIIKGTDSIDAILDSLVYQRTNLMNSLMQMKKLALEGIAGRAVDSKSFDNHKQYLEYAIESACVYGMRLFNGGSLKVHLGDQTKTYDLPKLSTTTFNLDNSVLTNNRTTSSSLQNLFFSAYWIRDWTVTGHAPSFEIQNIPKQELLKPIFGKLSNEKQMTVIKMLNGELVSH